MILKAKSFSGPRLKSKLVLPLVKSTARAARANGGVNHERVARCLEFADSNFARPIPLHELVSISGMSRRGLIKAFKRHVGQSPAAYMRQARIEFAKRLLTEQDLPLKTLAAITGFRSENTFCVAFSRATGLAPKQYQRQAWLSVYRRLNLSRNS